MASSKRVERRWPALVVAFGANPAQSAEIGPSQPLSAETLARLRALGYLGGTGVVEAAGAQPRPHPRDVLPVLNEVNVIVSLEPQIGPDEVIRPRPAAA